MKASNENLIIFALIPSHNNRIITKVTSITDLYRCIFLNVIVGVL